MATTETLWRRGSLRRRASTADPCAGDRPQLAAAETVGLVSEGAGA